VSDPRSLVRVEPLPLPTRVDSLEPLATALDATSQDRRADWLHRLGARQLRALVELSEGTALCPEDFVRQDGVMIAMGKNHLPLLFNRFQKRFARVGDEVVGYNHTSALATFFSGPGHFVVLPSPEVEGEVWFDYTRLPAGQHPEFPPLEQQHRLLFPLVYGDMVDVIRRVSRDVVVGWSTKPSGRWGFNAGALFAVLLDR